MCRPPCMSRAHAPEPTGRACTPRRNAHHRCVTTLGTSRHFTLLLVQRPKRTCPARAQPHLRFFARMVGTDQGNRVCSTCVIHVCATLRSRSSPLSRMPDNYVRNLMCTVSQLCAIMRTSHPQPRLACAFTRTRLVSSVSSRAHHTSSLASHAPFFTPTPCVSSVPSRAHHTSSRAFTRTLRALRQHTHITPPAAPRVRFYTYTTCQLCVLTHTSHLQPRLACAATRTLRVNSASSRTSSRASRALSHVHYVFALRHHAHTTPHAAPRVRCHTYTMCQPCATLRTTHLKPRVTCAFTCTRTPCANCQPARAAPQVTLRMRLHSFAAYQHCGIAHTPHPAIRTTSCASTPDHTYTTCQFFVHSCICHTSGCAVFSSCLSRKTSSNKRSVQLHLTRESTMHKYVLCAWTHLTPIVFSRAPSACGVCSRTHRT